MLVEVLVEKRRGQILLLGGVAGAGAGTPRVSTSVAVYGPALAAEDLVASGDLYNGGDDVSGYEPQNALGKTKLKMKKTHISITQTFSSIFGATRELSFHTKVSYNLNCSLSLARSLAHVSRGLMRSGLLRVCVRR